jgi:gamma-glutamyltranspeptidase
VAKTVAPAIDTSVVGSPRFVWDAIETGDTLVGLATPNGSARNASVQIGGTFGGATVTLQASNDGTTYFAIKDMHGTNISATAAGGFEFVSSAAFLRPTIASGSTNSVVVSVVLRG